MTRTLKARKTWTPKVQWWSSPTAIPPRSSAVTDWLSPRMGHKMRKMRRVWWLLPALASGRA
jgi:hypothetical protein